MAVNIQAIDRCRDLIKKSIKAGFNTVDVLQKRAHYITKPSLRLLLNDMVAQGEVVEKKFKGVKYYSVVPEYNWHDPFGVCGTFDPDKLPTLGTSRIHRITTDEDRARK